MTYIYIYIVFVLETFSYFLLVAFVSLGLWGSQQLCISISKISFVYLIYLLRLSVWVTQFFIPHILFISLCLIVWFLKIYVFVCVLQFLKQSSLKGIYCICNFSAKLRPHTWQYLVTLPHVMINVGDCISCCRLELAFLYHEKHTYCQ